MMKYNILPGIAFLIINFCMSCTSPEKELFDLTSISVTWELKRNIIGTTENSAAVFILKNNSQYNLDSKNWKLFFNQSPRPLVKNNSHMIARVEHINGDYYQLAPSDNFILKPGDSIEIPYEFKWVMLKESDAPRGLYFVQYNRWGKELAIIPAKNYRINPIPQEKTLGNASSSDYLPSSPEWQYMQNEQIRLLPENEWQILVPSPVKVIRKSESVTIDSTFIIVSQKGLENEARYFNSTLKSLVGFSLNYSETAKPNDKCISLKQKRMSVNGINNESYKISISRAGIEITGNDAAGIFYGIQSFLAQIPIENIKKTNSEIKLKSIYIEDAPRFQYRGMHIDVCRHFQPKAEILKVIDIMAFYKLNKLHLYLTEDEGWRIEIKGLPELTELGSKRGHCPLENKMLNPAYGSGPYSDEKLTNGSGYYSQEDFIEILKYAHNRHIQVIPSINFPGHARAAIKSMEERYRRLKLTGKFKEAKEFRLINPEEKSEYISAQFYDDNIVNVSLESVYRFYETVIDEIADMYNEASVPFKFIHTGGDEVPEGAWSKSAECAKVMNEMQIEKPRNLQAYFFERILKILDKYNLTAGGWEEVALIYGEDGELIVNPKFAGKNVVPYVWNNLQGSEDLGYKLANAGYPVVLCCATNFYLDFAYNKDPLEPGLYWGGYTDEYKPWIAEPFNLIGDNYNKSGLVQLKNSSRKNIIGLQAQLWGETVNGSEMLEYYLFPKMISFAEKAWASKPTWEGMRNSKTKTRIIDIQWNKFINPISQRELQRLNYLFEGYNYRVPPPGAIIDNGILKANSQHPGLDIYYTTDGTTPDVKSVKFIQPVKVKSDIKLISIDRAGKKSRVVTVVIEN